MNHPTMSCYGYGYGYGAAGIPLPLPAVTDTAPGGRLRLYHPLVIGLLFSLLIVWLTRSCMMPVTRPTQTILWLHRPPETPDIVVARPAPPQAVSEAVEEKISPPAAPPPPELMTRQEIREKPMPMQKQEPIPVPDRPVSPDVRKMADSRVDSIGPDTMRRETGVAPAAAPEALSRQQQRVEDRVVYYRNSTRAISPDQAPARSVQTRTETPSRPVPERAAVPGFTPLPRSQNVERPVQASAPEIREHSSTLIAGGKTVAVEGGGTVSRPVSPSVEQNDRSGEGRFVSPGKGFSPDLPAVGAPSAVSEESLTDAERVTITGLVTGESARVQNLKRMIFQKARSLGPGTYCCRIQDVQCRLRISAEERISITVSRDSLPLDRIPFDIVSRLERLLPEGVEACVE